MLHSNPLARGLVWALTLQAGMGAWALGEPGTPPPTHLADFQHPDRPENQWSAGLRVTGPGGPDPAGLVFRDPIFNVLGAGSDDGGKTVELQVAELVPGEDAVRPWAVREARRVRVDTGWAKGLLAGFGPGATPPRGGRMFRIRFVWTPPTADALAGQDPEAKTERKQVAPAFAESVLGLWAEEKDRSFQLRFPSAVWAHRNRAGDLAISGGDAEREGTFFSFSLHLVAPPVPAPAVELGAFPDPGGDSACSGPGARYNSGQTIAQTIAWQHRHCNFGALPLGCIFCEPNRQPLFHNPQPITHNP
jgi:hypothetical protein